MNKIIDKVKSFFRANTEVITPTAVLAIICVFVTLALSSTNLLTAARIEALAVENQNKAMAKLIEADEYTLQTVVLADEEVEYNAAIKDGETIGLIFVTEANGYGGTVSVMTAVNMDGTVAAIEILDASNETPGLGQNITKAEWYAQFSGLKNDITVVKGGAASAENNEINAVTGATISSTAVKDAVNQALSYAAEIIVEGEEA